MFAATLLLVALGASVVADAPARDATAATETKPAEPALDRSRDVVTDVVTRSAQAVDNLFGSRAVDESVSVSRGRISLGGQWDDRNGFDERFRLKARIALPGIKDRYSLLLGRSNADDFVDGLDDQNIDRLPSRFDDFDEDDWLIGVGYRRGGSLRRGWNFDAGIKLRTPLEPYVRANYFWNRSFGDQWLWRLRPRLFWQSQRGSGASVQQTIDYALARNWLLRSYSIFVVDEEERGVTWTTKFTGYQNLSELSAIAYSAYANGKPEAEVSLLDYGLEVRYRRQFLRDWFFVEFLTYLSWPREFVSESREPTPGIGIEFEMQFGDWSRAPE